MRVKFRRYAKEFILLAGLSAIAMLLPAAHPIIETQFASTLVSHTIYMLPPEMNKHFKKYMMDVYEGYKQEQNTIREKKNLEGINPLKRVETTEKLLIKWLKNYKGEDGPVDFKLTRKMDRIMRQHGSLLKEIDEFYRMNNPNLDDLMARFYDSDMVIRYEGYKPMESVKNILNNEMTTLKKKSQVTLQQMYQSLMTACVNSIILIHSKAGREVNVSSIQPRQIVVSNSIMIDAPLSMKPGGVQNLDLNDPCTRSCIEDMRPCVEHCLQRYTDQLDREDCLWRCRRQGIECLKFRCGMEY